MNKAKKAGTKALQDAMGALGEEGTKALKGAMSSINKEAMKVQQEAINKLNKELKSIEKQLKDNAKTLTGKALEDAQKELTK